MKINAKLYSKRRGERKDVKVSIKSRLGWAFILMVLFVMVYSVAYAGVRKYVIDGRVVSYNYPPISIYVNGVKKAPAVEPLMLNSRVLVHIRFIAEQFGAKITGYDSSKVSMSYNGKNITFYYNKNVAYVNGSPVQLDASVKLVNKGYTYVPLRFVVETFFNKNVRWDNWSVYIDNKATPVVNVKNVSYADGKLVVQADGAISFNKFNMTSPDRLVLDFNNAILNLPDGSKGKSIDVNSNGIRQIRYSQFTSSPDPNTVRVVVEFDKMVNYEIATADDKKALPVVFDKLQQPADPPSPQPPASNYYTVDSVQYGMSGKSANVTISTKATDFYVDRLDNPSRVYMDIHNARLNNVPGTVSVKDNIVDIVKVGQYSADTVRVAVYLNADVSYQVLKQDGALVLSLTPVDNSKKTIVVDAGHGGSDPGAVGNNLRESDVVLQIAKKLQSLLAAGGYNVVMTRTDDSYVGLYDRPQLANQLNADVFVSIHANSYSSSSAKGTEVLYFNNIKLAQIVHDELMKQVDTIDRGLVERPHLVVLNSTNMPSILVETAFISNPDDAKKLSSDDYQWRFARGIYNGIVKFLSQ